MPTDTKLNQLVINQLTQEQYDEAKAAGTLSTTELYITDNDDDAQVKSNLSQTIDDSTTKYPSNKAVKDESSRIMSVMDNQYSNLLSTLYPVGSIYIGTQNSCPLATLIAGSTWEIVSEGRALWGGNGTDANSNIEAGLPDIVGDFSPCGLASVANSTGCFSTISNTVYDYEAGIREMYGARIRFNASSSSTIYGKSNTVQPPAYRVNIWRRTA